MIKLLTQEQINTILISAGIAIGFRVSSSILAYAIIKIFRLEKKQKAKFSSFYKPLKGLFITIGIYWAIMFLRKGFEISDTTIAIVNKIFKISIILIIAKGMDQAVSVQSKIIKKLNYKINHNKSVDDNSLVLIIKIAKVIIYTVAIVLIIQELGYDLKGLIAGLGIGGVIITLAAQDTAKNLFGGLVIFLDKPFRVGDYIEAETYSGTVEDITFRSTAIRTLDDSLLHIPNSEMSSIVITNWSEINKRRYKTNLVVTLETPLDRIEKTEKEIRNMLAMQEEVFSDTIMINFENILESGIEIVIIAYVNIINYREYLNLKEKLNYQIMKILENNHVELAYNTQTIHVKN